MPVAAARRSRVRVEGLTRPLSRRAMTACVVCMRSASCCCLRPARARVSISAAAEREFVFKRIVRLDVFRILPPYRERFLDGNGLAHAICRSSAAVGGMRFAYRLSFTYSKSPGLLSMPALGGAIQEA